MKFSTMQNKSQRRNPTRPFINVALYYSSHRNQRPMTVKIITPQFQLVCTAISMPNSLGLFSEHLFEHRI